MAPKIFSNMLFLTLYWLFIIPESLNMTVIDKADSIQINHSEQYKRFRKMYTSLVQSNLNYPLILIIHHCCHCCCSLYLHCRGGFRVLVRGVRCDEWSESKFFAPPGEVPVFTMILVKEKNSEEVNFVYIASFWLS